MIGLGMTHLSTTARSAGVSLGVCLAGALAPCIAGAAHAQQATDIFIADVTMRAGQMHIGTPVNVTNRAGYDNQPWFLPDGRALLYVSQREGQTDVFRYDVATRSAMRVTDTPENEYSPSLPGDGSRMLVVRWPTDMSTGALWWFTRDGAPIERAPGSVARVGYYAVVDERTLALFINDSIQSFLLADTRSGDTIRVGQDMGGSGPRTIPGQRAVSFLRRDTTGARWLTRLNVSDRAVTPLVRMPDGVANYAWTPRGTVLAARANTIYEWTPGATAWRPVASFDQPALQNMSRIAVSAAGDRIAIVSARPPD